MGKLHPSKDPGIPGTGAHRSVDHLAPGDSYRYLFRDPTKHAGGLCGRSLSIFMLSVPEFWIATIVLVYPAIYFGWSPPMQYVPFIENPQENLLMFLVPGAILGAVHSGPLMRLVRTLVLEVLRQDYELLSKVVFELKSSGNPDFRNHFDSIRELYTFNHLCQVIKAP